MPLKVTRYWLIGNIDTKNPIILLLFEVVQKVPSILGDTLQEGCRIPFLITLKG